MFSRTDAAGKNDREGAGEKDECLIQQSRGWQFDFVKLDQQARFHPSDDYVHLEGEIIEDCLAATRTPTRFDELLKSLQVSLSARRHHSQCISCRFNETLRVIL